MKLDFSVSTLNRPQPQSADINYELINLIKNYQQAAQLSNVQLANKLGYKNINKTMRNLRDFKKTGEIADSYLHKIGEILNIDLDEIRQVQARYVRDKFSDRTLFIQHFDQVWAHRALIIGAASYANISFPGICLSVAYLGAPGYNIGILLQHYMNGHWRADNVCCDRVYIIAAGGSPLSGTNSCHGFCRRCRSQKSFRLPAFGTILKAHKDLKPACQQRATDKTMADLLHDFQS